MAFLQPVLGILVLLGVAWLLSVDRRAVRWRPVIGGLALQLAFVLVVLRTPAGRAFFDGAQRLFTALLSYAKAGGARVIGESALGRSAGSAPILAAVILASVVFFASLFALLHHLGIVRLIVGGMAWVMARTLRTSGAESASAAANIFVGQTEAPLLIRPYLSRMTPSEIGAVMTVGFSTIAGGVFGIYVEMLQGRVPGIAGHLLAASVMSAPAGLAVAKLIFPETGRPETLGRDAIQPRSEYANLVEAIAGGAGDGMRLSLNILGMLIAFLAFLELVNALLGAVTPGGWEPLTLQGIFGWLLSPMAWLLGVPWSDAPAVGSLLGVKIAVNEFVAYRQLAGSSTLSPEAATVASYALCGFANFSSIAIQIGGLGGMCPERRGEIARLGLRAMFGGAIASWCTAATAALVL